MKKMNIEKLRADRRALEERIRALKTALRRTWTEPMASVQRQLCAAKLEATELCILRAHLRGKQHLGDRERCDEVVMRRSVEYAIVEAA